jgi:hypothetical protein
LKPGNLLGSVSGELCLRKFLEERGHTLVVTFDKDGSDSVFERELPDAEVVISQPFWPAYLTAGRILARQPRAPGHPASAGPGAAATAALDGGKHVLGRCFRTP